jgi:uncharacterized membrane protein
MTVDVADTIVIERPIGQVAAFAGDPSNAPDWYRRISSATWETNPPIALGSRIAFRARFMGRDLDYTYEVTEYTPDEQVAMKTAEGPFPMATTYTWRPIGPDKTHMVLRNRGEPAGFWKLAAPLMARAMRRAMRQDLVDLKRLLESR